MKFILYCGCSVVKLKVKSDYRSKFSNLTGRKKPEKYQGKWRVYCDDLQPQCNMNFIYISHHFTAWEDMNSTNWPCSQCVASQLSWSSITPVSQSYRSRVQIPLKPWYFSGFFLPIDLFSLYILFSHFRPRDATRGNSFFQNVVLCTCKFTHN